MEILLTISKDVKEAKTKKNMLGSSQSMSREEDERGFKKQRQVFAGQLEGRIPCLNRAPRRKGGQPSRSKIKDRRRCLMRALLRKKEMGLRISKKNAVFSK